MPNHISTIPDDLTGRLNWFYENYFEPAGHGRETYKTFDLFVKELCFNLRFHVSRRLWSNYITREYLPNHIVEDMDQWYRVPGNEEFLHIWDIHSALEMWEIYLDAPCKADLGYHKHNEEILKTLTSRWITDLVLQDYEVIFDGERISLDELSVA